MDLLQYLWTKTSIYAAAEAYYLSYCFFFTCVFGKVESKIKGCITNTHNINLKMMFFKLSCLSFIQLYLHRMSIRCFQAKLSLNLHHFFLALCIPTIYTYLSSDEEQCTEITLCCIASRFFSWNEMLTYWMSRRSPFLQDVAGSRF